MKRLVLFAIAAALATSTTISEARPHPVGRASSFEANKVFGLGLELGDVAGLTGKYFLSSSHALDFGVGTFGYYNYRDRYAAGGLHLYGDYLFHPIDLVSTEPFELPLYIGVGARLWSYDYDRNGQRDGDYAIGVRVPIGIAFDFNNVPLDIFIQIVPTLDFAHRYYDNTYFDVDFSFGIRYWFK